MNLLGLVFKKALLTKNLIFCYCGFAGAVSGFLPGGGRDIFTGWRNLPGGGEKNVAAPPSPQRFLLSYTLYYKFTPTFLHFRLML